MIHQILIIQDNLKEEFDSLILNSSSPDKVKFIAWFTSLGDDYATAWMTALPKNRDSIICNKAFLIILQRWFHIPIKGVNGMKCKCSKTIDPIGIHITTSCSFGGMRTAIHNCMLDLIYKFLQLNDIKCSKEQVSNDKNNRRCDILLNELLIQLDVTIGGVYGFGREQLSLKQAKKVNRTCNALVVSKTAKYSESKLVDDATLKVCAIENTGRFHPDLKKFINDIIEKNSIGDGENLKRYWARRLSVCFQKQTALAIIKRTKKLRLPWSLYYDDALAHHYEEE